MKLSHRISQKITHLGDLFLFWAAPWPGLSSRRTKWVFF